jgi:hypothetical protein
MLGHGPISGTPISALHEWRSHVACSSELAAALSASEFFYAATMPFITRERDAPRNQPFSGTLDSSLRVDRSIANGNGYNGYVQNVAELSLINADGEYDVTGMENSPNGQEIVCTIGEVLSGDKHGRNVVAPYSTFQVLARLTGEKWRVDRNRITLESRDFAAKLDVPVQTSVYAGTGGLEGGSDLAGKRRPIAFGRLYAADGRGGNVSPTLVIASEGLWQVHDGAVTSINAVRDGGVALAFVADYANVTLLRAAGTGGTIGSAQYGTCIAEGYFLVGGSGFKQITCDVVSPYLKRADVIKHVVLTSAAISLDHIDTDTFDALNVSEPGPIAYYLDSNSNETCAEMFTKLMAGIEGWYGFTTLGVLQVKRMEAPAAADVDIYDLAGGNLIDIDRTDLPAAVATPPHRRRLTYAHNWTTQTELYGQVSENDPAFADYLGKPYLVATTSDAESLAILSDYPFAPDPDPVLSYYADAADALAGAERLLALYSSGYKPYRMTAKQASFLHQVGDVIFIQDSGILPRLGLGPGKYVRLVEVNDDTGKMQTEMIGFG